MWGADTSTAAYSGEQEREGTENVVPFSLLAILALVLLSLVEIFVPLFSSTLLRLAISIPLLLFAPGYALLAAIAPEAPRVGDDPDVDGFSRPGTLQRLTYAVVLSLVVVPLVGYGLNFTAYGIRLVPVVLLVSAGTLLATTVAVYRWLSLPPIQRFSLDLGWHASHVWEDVVAGRGRLNTGLNVVLVVALLVACGALVYGGTVTSEAGHSELFLATEQPDGSIAIGDYPSSLERGAANELVVGVVNEEGETQTYTVVATLERVEDGVVTDSEVLERTQRTVEDGDRWTHSSSISPTITGENLRLTFALYLGDEAVVEDSEPTHMAYVWVSVSDGEAA